MSSEKSKDERTWTEEIEVFGHELVDKVKKLVSEGNVRRLIVRSPEGQVLIELPLTAGVAVGGVVTLMAPVLAALGALAALLVHAKVQVVRTGQPETPRSDPQRPDPQRPDSQQKNEEAPKTNAAG
jgi:hypothetical protein